MLTYMATLTELEKSGELVRIEVDLEYGEQPWRTLYGTKAFIDWLSTELPDLSTTIVGLEIEPYEQVDAVFHEYVIGTPLSPDHRFKRLSWTPDLSVWEFKTADVRIFGWVPAKDVFICCFGDMKDDIELRRAYGRYIAQTQYVRSQMNLDEPKLIESREYSDVLSDAPPTKE